MLIVVLCPWPKNPKKGKKEEEKGKRESEGKPKKVWAYSSFLVTDLKEESCQREKAFLKRKLSESAVEIERQVSKSKANFTC